MIPRKCESFQLSEDYTWRVLAGLLVRHGKSDAIVLLRALISKSCATRTKCWHSLICWRRVQIDIAGLKSLERMKVGDIRPQQVVSSPRCPRGVCAGLGPTRAMSTSCRNCTMRKWRCGAQSWDTTSPVLVCSPCRRMVSLHLSVLVRRSLSLLRNTHQLFPRKLVRRRSS